jgi:hypothetical protein
MRFLLHPRRSSLVKGSGSCVLSRAAAVKEARLVAVLPNVRCATEHERPPRNTAAVRLRDRGLSRIPTSTKPVPPRPPELASSHRRAWGQQCSEHCGCVVRFEAEIRNGTVEAASYHAKQLVLTKPRAAATTTTTTSLSSSHHAPCLTAKGRPMLKGCDCAALHHLSSVVVDHMVGQDVRRLKNSLEFRSPRSSAAFRSAALRAQGLPPEGGAKCFDLVEEAVTALLKGHLPKPRPIAVGPATARPPPAPWSVPETQPTRRLPVPRHAWQEAHGTFDDDDNNNNDDEGAFPNMFWRLPLRHDGGSDGQGPADEHWHRSHDGSGPSPTSTLRLLDLEHDRTSASSRRDGSSYLPHRHRRGRRRRGVVPRDWVSYVDELHWRHESSA